MKKIGLLVLPLMLVLIMGVFVGCGKKYDFADDIVIVVLTEEASLSANSSGKIYKPEDFPELKLSHVDNAGIQPGQTRILTLYLQEPNHKTVLLYIEILGRSADIQDVGPSRSGSIA